MFLTYTYIISTTTTAATTTKLLYRTIFFFFFCERQAPFAPFASLPS